MVRRVMLERDTVFTINDCNIHVPEDANGLLDGHDKWSAQVDFHQFDKAQAVIVTRPASLLAALSSSSFGFLLKQGRRVCLSDGPHQDGCDTPKNEDNPIRPAPTKVLCHESADDWANHCEKSDYTIKKEITDGPGPFNGPIDQILNANARYSSETISPTVPGALAIMELPATAPKNLITMISAILVALAHGMISMQKMIMVIE